MEGGGEGDGERVAKEVKSNNSFAKVLSKKKWQKKIGSNRMDDIDD